MDALAEHGDEAKLLAGGQSLVPVLNFRLAQPAVLIDLNRVPELDGVRPTADGGLSLGALLRQSQIDHGSSDHPEIARRAPLLVDAIHFVAHPQIRNRGTLGGSLAHADPAAELPVAAMALDARFRLVKRGGERWVDARGFFLGLFYTALEADELLAEIVLPPLPKSTGTSFMEIARRHGDYAQAGVAAVVTLDREGRCRKARLVYLGVGDLPMDAPRASASLVGEAPTKEVFEAAAQIAQDEIEPTGDIHASADFKRHLARVLTVRALTQACERASGRSTGEVG